MGEGEAAPLAAEAEEGRPEQPAGDDGEEEEKGKEREGGSESSSDEEGGDVEKGAAGKADDERNEKSASDGAPKEDAPASATPSAAAKPPPDNKFLAFLKSTRFEGAGRSTLIAFLGYILSVAYIPRAVPPAFVGLIGILAPTISVCAPRMAFAMGAMGPVLIVVFIFAIAVASMLLCGATVTNGLMTAVFSLCVIWFTGLRHGKDEKSTSAWQGLLTVIGGMITLSLWQLVQDGLSFTVHGSDEHREEVHAALVALCQELGMPDDCYVDSMPEFDGTVSVILPPGSGNVAGQTAYFTFDPTDYQVTVWIPGGMWIVALLWTAKGLTNPLAFFRNFMIALCWALLCIGCGVLCPPVRTARKMISNGMIPMAIRDVVSAVRANIAPYTDDEEEGGAAEAADESKPDNEEDDKDGGAAAAKAAAALQSRMIGTANTISDGSMAALVAYEIRLFKSPFECAWPKLKELMVAANRLNLSALSTYEPAVKEFGRMRQKGREALDRLELCAGALMKNGDASEFAQGGDDNDGNDGNDDEQSTAQYVAFSKPFFAKVRRVEAAAAEWLDSLHHPHAAGCKGCLVSYAPFVMPFVLMFKRLLVTLSLPFRPSRWDARTVLAEVKFSAGLIALFAMEVYWDAYRDFTLRDGTAGDAINSAITMNGDPPPQNFSGWALIGYLFANRPTTEGSLKKGLLRAVGTCLGGFSAWLGAIICSGTYETPAPLNPYGFVAWFTFTHALGVYFALDNGPLAMVGMSADHGWAAFYMCMTQAICATNIYGGSNRDNIVVNRVVANLVGILMAAVLSIAPPQVRGGDPNILRNMLKTQRDSFADGLRWLLLAGTSSNATEEQEAKLVKDVERIRDDFADAFLAARKHAEFLIKDADRLRILPFYRVDPRMMQQLHSISVTGTFVYRGLEHVRALLEAASDGGERGEGQRRRLADEGLRGDIEANMRRLEGMGKLEQGADAGMAKKKGNEKDEEEGGGEAPKEYESAKNDKEARDMKVLIDVIDNIIKRFEDHEAVMADIKEATWPW